MDNDGHADAGVGVNSVVNASGLAVETGVGTAVVSVGLRAGAVINDDSQAVNRMNISTVAMTVECLRTRLSLLRCLCRSNLDARLNLATHFTRGIRRLLKRERGDAPPGAPDVRLPLAHPDARPHRIAERVYRWIDRPVRSISAETGEEFV